MSSKKKDVKRCLPSNHRQTNDRSILLITVSRVKSTRTTNRVWAGAHDHQNITRSSRETASSHIFTAFIKFRYSYLVSFEQDEEECEHLKSKTPNKCKLAIIIKQKSVDPQQCHKCEEKLRKKKKPAK
ncbi:uncharacterized protein NECHADRAFT_83133 [Fusarium vanettenii 77-13-4]|uniref:Uncharacterized protein n=1 Tax=Fusarium vanettenii (strain ATCC MYA-4622 / CBS 123669 / FGSC 9596 / NRRL 45880 / 77-13-4) TaxID=660122 RepID=C7ZB18_FUSV7|nr:uncharacterized protein NECHADRAFT_83133 [Fusarium vanettenii 77-13-4]EEU38717.1 predicted protein [Fusarium vanettenii 77-13-4]